MLLFLGVDRHKDSLAACLVDQTGAQLAAATFLNIPGRHGDLLAWIGRSGQPTRAGIEGGPTSVPGWHGSCVTRALMLARCPAR